MIKFLFENLELCTLRTSCTETYWWRRDAVASRIPASSFSLPKARPDWFQLPVGTLTLVTPVGPPSPAPPITLLGGDRRRRRRQGGPETMAGINASERAQCLLSVWAILRRKCPFTAVSISKVCAVCINSPPPSGNLVICQRAHLSALCFGDSGSAVSRRKRLDAL